MTAAQQRVFAMMPSAARRLLTSRISSCSVSRPQEQSSVLKMAAARLTATNTTSNTGISSSSMHTPLQQQKQSNRLFEACVHGTGRCHFPKTGVRSASSSAARRKDKAAEKKSSQEKLEEADKNAKKKDVPLGMLKADGSSKRFYKAAGVQKIDQDDPRTGTLKTMWSLTLDGRGVRTPANKLLTLPNKNMAMAIALEFDVQDLHILPYTMPMTTLATTAIDQISRSDVRKSSITGLLRQLNNDLITLRSNEPDDLVASEDHRWGAICDWASTYYKCSVKSTDNWLHLEQDPALLQAVEGDLQQLSDWSLAVIDNVSGATGSTLIAVSLYHGFLDSDAANKAARVQEQYQVDRWGMVEASGMGGHDIDAADMRARLAAASVFLRLLPTNLK